MEDVHLDGECKYYSSDATVSGDDLEGPDIIYRGAYLPRKEKLVVFMRSNKILSVGEQEARYRSHTDIGYRTGDLVFHSIFNCYRPFSLPPQQKEEPLEIGGRT